MKFEGHVVLITGASSGIGAALARELAREGARLVLMARRRERLAAVALAVERYGRLDVAIANAGFGVVGPLAKLGVEDYRRQFETNVFAAIETSRACLAELVKAQGRLVLIGSVAGYISTPNASPYAMSKFAIRAFAEALRPELAPQGVAVTLISPGFVTSEIRQVDNRGGWHPKAKDALPTWLPMPAEHAARKIVSAIHRRRREAIITTHGKVLVWLSRFAPWALRLAMRRGVRGRPEPKRP